MSLDLEIVEFKFPIGNRRNLFVTGIPKIDEIEILETLYNTFSQYGLIYGTQIFPYSNKGTTTENPSHCTTTASNSGFYAFVTFYLVMSARKAKEETKGKILIGNTECMIAYAKKKKEWPGSDNALYFQKCQELANHYLGFNGWSVIVKFVDKECTQTGPGTFLYRHICVSKLEIVSHGLHTEGMGAWEETYTTADPMSKASAMVKAKKISYQRSVENAFSKVLLIVLSNGKVTVEIDTTKEELLLTKKDLDSDNLLQVNELDNEPEISSEEGLEDTDDVNIQILRELEDT